MADGSDGNEAVGKDKKENETVTKSVAKRKFLLTDDELLKLTYEEKQNPFNKGYAPMKLFKLSDVETLALQKWSSMEQLDAERELKRKKRVKMDNKKEEETKHLWNTGELYKPLESYMKSINLPRLSLSPYFSNSNKKATEDKLIDCDVVIGYLDCMHSLPPGANARSLYKHYPRAREVDRSTPYNDRRKMGHFSWTTTDLLDKEQVIVNVYAVHKWSTGSKVRSSIPILNTDALCLAWRRLSKLLAKALEKEGRSCDGLNIGTYTPYKMQPEQFQMLLDENFTLPVNVYSNLQGQTE